MPFQHIFFDTYRGYFLQALPFAVLAGLFYGLIKYRKDKKTHLARKIFASVFVGYVVGVVLLVLFKEVLGSIWYFLIYHNKSGNPVYFFSGHYVFKLNFYKRMNAERIGNLMLLVPFGLLFPVFKKNAGFFLTIAMALAFTTAIELLQPIVGRTFDLNDIVLNFAGGVIGAIIFFTGRAVYRLVKKI
ncbi:MAG: VanZ family protein [Lachnospiraceae bacterium]|nr:VanZ family protein [Lachnospiraceae bacterium]